MDAVLENVRNSLEVGVRKIWSDTRKKENVMSQSDKNKPISKLFGASLCDICNREFDTVPYIVRDICTFIGRNYLSCNDIFRSSSPTSHIVTLRHRFERCFCTRGGVGVCSITGSDGYTAANVLKHFFRQLSKPLIPDEILELSKEQKCISDENFAANVRSRMETWPAAHRCTLQYLLSFLKLVARDLDNRMTIPALALVFGPTVFKISGNAKPFDIETLANQTFERLLLASDIICGNYEGAQRHLNMASVAFKPARLAPPVPKQARPLPPPPVPTHISDDIVVTSSPVVPLRSTSLKRNFSAGDFSSQEFNGSISSNKFSEGDALKASIVLEGVPPLAQLSVDDTIRDVVHKHLFTIESPHRDFCFDEPLSRDSSSDDDDTDHVTVTPTMTNGPYPLRKQRSLDDISPLDDDTVKVSPLPKKTLQVITTMALSSFQSGISEQTDSCVSRKEPNSPAVTVVTTATTTVTTPDSGCLTMEEELPKRMQHCDENNEPIFIPKLNLQDTEDEDVLCDVRQIVPRLDLSGVTQFDEVAHPKAMPKKERGTPTKSKKRRKKSHKSSPIQNKPTPQTYSDPINIPTPSHHLSRQGVDDSPNQYSPQDGNSRWRDAWSTDEETLPALSAMENVTRHDVRFHPPLDEDNIELAPSSPENHIHRHHPHHHHHHRYHHHHHDNHRHHHDNQLSRAKMSSSLNETNDNFEDIYTSLQEISDALDLNRREDARPEDITLMTREQIRCEKIAMQRELLKHESRHGRPSSKEEKEIMRNLYERYRMVKRLLADTLVPPFNISLNRRLDDVEQDYDVNLMQHSDEFAVTQLVTLAPFDGKRKNCPSHLRTNSNDHISANLGIFELRKQEREAKGRRKRLRKKLRDFEKEVEQEYGRSINPTDRIAMATEYSEYRDLKAKLRLLDALIEKHNSQHRSL